MVPNDDNRVADGRDLRHEFLEEDGLGISPSDAHWMELGCSVLELLLVLARRLEFELGGDVEYWFWDLLGNLGLAMMHDDVPYRKDEVQDILNRFIFRQYNYNGGGGLFPLEEPDMDQREVELWYQLDRYVTERS